MLPAKKSARSKGAYSQEGNPGGDGPWALPKATLFMPFRQFRQPGGGAALTLGYKLISLRDKRRRLADGRDLKSLALHASLQRCGQFVSLDLFGRGVPLDHAVEASCDC